MAEPAASRTWVCERDDRDPAAPSHASLLIGDEPVASARGVDEVSAFARLAEDVGADGRVLGMVGLMRRWREPHATRASNQPSCRPRLSVVHGWIRSLWIA
jgi:hypothetical protein